MSGRHHGQLAVPPQRRVRRGATWHLTDRHLGQLVQRLGFSVGEADKLGRLMTEIFDRQPASPLRRLSYFLEGYAGQVDPGPLAKPPTGSPGTVAVGWPALDGAAEACAPA